MAIALVSSSPADSGEREDEQYWYEKRAHNELFDRQKALLAKQDELDYRIQELKRKIKFFSKDLLDAQNDLDQVQHELVIMRVKLL
jgi:hypothetical protein